MTYHQITLEERYRISALRQEGHYPAAIARRVGRHRSTISREFARNRSRCTIEHQRRKRARARPALRSSPGDGPRGKSTGKNDGGVEDSQRRFCRCEGPRDRDLLRDVAVASGRERHEAEGYWLETRPQSSGSATRVVTFETAWNPPFVT